MSDIIKACRVARAIIGLSRGDVCDAIEELGGDGEEPPRHMIVNRTTLKVVVCKTCTHGRKLNPVASLPAYRCLP